MSCCVDCHLEYEEKHVFPLLPPEIRERLAADHAQLRAFRDRTGAWSIPMLLQHAEVEEQLFGHFLPDGMVAKMTADHQAIDRKIARWRRRQPGPIPHSVGAPNRL